MPTFGEAMMEVMEYEAKQKYLAIGKDEGKKEGRIDWHPQDGRSLKKPQLKPNGNYREDSEKLFDELR